MNKRTRTPCSTKEMRATIAAVDAVCEMGDALLKRLHQTCPHVVNALTQGMTEGTTELRVLMDFNGHGCKRIELVGISGNGETLSILDCDFSSAPTLSVV